MRKKERERGRLLLSCSAADCHLPAPWKCEPVAPLPSSSTADNTEAIVPPNTLTQRDRGRQKRREERQKRRNGGLSSLSFYYFFFP